MSIRNTWTGVLQTVQRHSTAGPWAHPTMGTGTLQWVKRLGRRVNHPPPSSVEVKERIELHLYSLSGPSWPVLERTLLLFMKTY